MALRVLAFARLRELLGFGERSLDVGPAATLEDVWTALTAASPEAGLMRASTRFARNGALVDDGSTPLSEGDEVALMPPVGGG